MTERKPRGVSFESWIDQQIREATERGEFDNLPGAGKPIADLDKPYDQVWVRRHLEREGVPADVLLPTPLGLRAEAGRLRETVRDLPSERAVRDTVSELNQRIAAWLRAPTGPAVYVRPVDADAVVEQWRSDRTADRAARRAARTPPAAAARMSGARTRSTGADAAAASTGAPRSSWWRRLLRREPGR